MQLQMAMDVDFTVDRAMKLADDMVGLVDILEFGTPMIINLGLDVITQVKSKHPNYIYLADLKIMDAGEYETQLAIEAGADIITVLAAAEDKTIAQAIKTAHTHGKKIMVDLIAVKNIEARAREVCQLGADYVCLHTAKDVQSEKDSMDFTLLDPAAENCGLAVAGGITPDNAIQYVSANPDILIVGSGLVDAMSPIEAAQKLKTIIGERRLVG